MELLKGTETILLVEDDEMLRAITLEILKKCGYQILESLTVTDAIRIAEQYTNPIQLLVTDVVMPDMKGHELAKHLSRSHPEMKVLFTSGYTDNVIVCYGILEEGVPFLQKPYSAESMVSKVREVLDSDKLKAA